MSKKVYVAGPFERRYEIKNTWSVLLTLLEFEVCASWLEVPGGVPRTGDAEHTADEQARLDLEEVRACDVFVIDARDWRDPVRGALIELGVALADADKTVVWIGRKEHNIFTVLCDAVVDDWVDALRWLKENCRPGGER